MKVSRIEIRGFRSFSQTTALELGRINVLIGANNAGKSSVLRALYACQAGVGDLQADIREGSPEAFIGVHFTDLEAVPIWSGATGSARLEVVVRPGAAPQRTLHMPDGSVRAGNEFPASEPNHFVVPYLSKRKASGFAEDVSEGSAMRVSSQMTNLPAKLARISNATFPGHDRYRDTSMAVLGCVVTAIPSNSGMRAGVYLKSKRAIWIDQMGDGVPNIVSLLADLALSENKLFLVEEPENDLHPQALKALLDLMIESSSSNQFVVSTHSNIVLRYLGAADGSRVYSVQADRDVWPIDAQVTSIAPAPESRLAVLRDLGYSLSDFDLWEGWLILEESSAERLIRDYLIPWFVPNLSRLRTLSANGVDSVEPTFQDFNRLVRFTHLEDTYRGRAWVRVDGDEAGKRVIDGLRTGFSGWPSDNFQTYSEAQFERYYPTDFKARAEAALSTTNKQEKREAKRRLLVDVLAWLDADKERGKQALAQSAAEIISDLISIEAQMDDRTERH